MWLNAYREPTLPTSLLAGTEFAADDFCLVKLIHTVEKKDFQPTFQKYFCWFYNPKNFSESLALYARLDRGLKWFRDLVTWEQDSPAIWQELLSWDVFASGFDKKKSIKFICYQPNLFARQFGLSQCTPYPMFMTRKDLICELFERPSPSSPWLWALFLCHPFLWWLVVTLLFFYLQATWRLLEVKSSFWLQCAGWRPPGEIQRYALLRNSCFRTFL